MLKNQEEANSESSILHETQKSEITTSEIKEMEVHHHPHVDPDSQREKKFKEYFLEFLMIFLAVTMGFFAENIREQRDNSEIVKRNMEIIIDNLKADTAQLSYVINGNIKRSLNMDSLVLQKQYDISDTNVLKRVINLYLNNVTDYIFHSNNAALEQMKSSGALRLVKSKLILDSLFNYSYTNWLLDYDGKYYTHQSSDLNSIANKLFDYPLPGRRYIPINLKQKEDLIQEFFNVTGSISYQIRMYYLKLLQEQRVHASNLIKLLKGEYDLNDE